MFEIDPEVVARERIDRYLKSVDATVVPAKGHVDIDELLRIYFEGTAPFSKEGKKKNEFPDAIALLSLEDWARNNAATLIAVSTDKDWYCVEVTVPETQLAFDIDARDDGSPLDSVMTLYTCLLYTSPSPRD